MQRTFLLAGALAGLVGVGFGAFGAHGLRGRLSFLLRPVFEANHRWAMAQGETSLKLELARRRADSPAAAAAIAAPPGPVTYAAAGLLAGAAAIGAGVMYLMLRTRRRSR